MTDDIQDNDSDAGAAHPVTFGDKALMAVSVPLAAVSVIPPILAVAQGRVPQLMMLGLQDMCTALHLEPGAFGQMMSQLSAHPEINAAAATMLILAGHPLAKKIEEILEGTVVQMLPDDVRGQLHVIAHTLISGATIALVLPPLLSTAAEGATLLSLMTGHTDVALQLHNLMDLSALHAQGGVINSAPSVLAVIAPHAACLVPVVSIALQAAYRAGVEGVKDILFPQDQAMIDAADEFARAWAQAVSAAVPGMAGFDSALGYGR
ncbi:hypothetical protein GC177_08210 [bacterium]|nr:hypothetical protein [bacterium]